MNTDMPILQSASTISGQIDQAMLGLLLICGGALFLVFALMLIFCIVYRKGSPHNRVIKKQGSLALEWGWTIATFVIFLGLFVWGVVIYFEMHVPPKGSAEITVVGKQWMWKFQHPNGRREINELHMPVSQPILLTMTSQDVIHSLFIPGFRIKQDVLPGRYTKTWFEASKIGEYELFCTQYCGTMHANMIGRVYVLSPSDYEKWLEDKTKPIEDPSVRGEKLFNSLGCINCHSEHSGYLGPSLEGLYGKRRILTTDESVLADENYIRESILNPNAKVVKGYKPLMPTFQGQVSEEDLLDLIAYIKSLGSHPLGSK